MNGFFKKFRLSLIFVPCVLCVAYVYSRFVKISLRPKTDPAPLPAIIERGSIVDRNGKPLAVQTNFYHFVVTPKDVKNPEDFAKKVCVPLKMSAEEIFDKITNAKNLNFVYLKKKISQEQYDELYKIVSDNDFFGFTRFDKIPGRLYPENSLASQLIGYMGDDGVGLSGIEYSKQSVLSPEIKKGTTGTIHGDNVYLTIDAGLQYKLEKIAQDAMEETRAESMMLIAANAKNGEILSYISFPSADLNQYTRATKEEMIDRLSVTAYEPGSVFKIFSVASFLDSYAITPDDSFLCDGIYQRKTNLGETIRITCLEHHGWLNARTALKFSCNDALAQMSEKIATDDFLSYIRRFGFGERTDVELPSETRGSVKNQNDRFWSARSKATISIGQEISVSALQMVQAATVLANKGVQVKLTFISKIAGIDGDTKFIHQPTLGNRVLKSSTADYLLSCMETTAKSGTGTKASLRDISIGVKTGTAQMADPVNGGYSSTDFLSNCMAIFPIENPQIILYIVIEKAKGETYAGRIVAPVIAKAADEIIDHLGINREGAASLEHSGRIVLKENSPLNVSTVVPNFVGRSKRDLLPLLNRTDLNVIINGEGWVKNQSPEPGTLITENMTIELDLE
jgi:cell division protein FtsI (penicillin-binding protein 3)